MSDFINYSEIKREIESKTCNVHDLRPEFAKTPNGFSITACCDTFRKSLAVIAEKLVAEQTESAIRKNIDDAFRM